MKAGCSCLNTWGISMGFVCGGAGCCCSTLKTGFSSTSAGTGAGAAAGTGAGDAFCASNEALVLLLRGAGAALGSFGSAALRGFLGFFSGSLGSLGFGLGPGFLRTVPAAVSLGVDVVDAGVGVLAVATP